MSATCSDFAVTGGLTVTVTLVDPESPELSKTTSEAVKLPAEE